MAIGAVELKESPKRATTGVDSVHMTDSEPPVPQEYRPSSVSPPTRPSLLTHRMLSLSTSSLTSLLPSFYLGANRSMPSLNGDNGDEIDGQWSDGTFVSDELARESDVTVSTTVTPQAEYKGFATYVISAIFLFVWLCWAVLPDKILNDIGIYYYPSKWWAVAIPAWFLIAMTYMYVALAFYNVEVLTVPLDDLRTVVDDSGVVVTQVPMKSDPERKNAQLGPILTTRDHDLDWFLHNSTSGIWDIPLSTVNEVIYGDDTVG